MIRMFHGWITESLLAQGRTRSEPFVSGNIRVLTNCWMEPGDKATFVFTTENVNIASSIANGRVTKKALCVVFPGHLEPGEVESWTAQEAAEYISHEYFRDCQEALALIEELGQRPAPSPEMVDEIVRRVLAEM